MTSLKKTDACGVDGITVSVLQLAAPIIAMPVAHLIALSFAQAKVPSAFKAAIVVPIHKGKGKPSNQPSSYRPVAILPALSKVLEKIVLWQLTPFLENKLPECQFGFRPARSSFSAVATAHGAWARATSAGQVTGFAAIDLTAAFDTVDHDILCSKLAGLGIQNRSLNWFRHYLEGRHQRVKYFQTLSSPSPLQCGVPQGSLLGPVLFLVLVHDLSMAMGLSPFPSSSGRTISYADDLVVWISGVSIKVARPVLESKSRSVAAYMTANCLSLNPEKTQVLWIESGSNTPAVLVSNSHVHPVDTVDILGMKFDRALRSDPHIQELNSAMASLAGVARCLRAYLPPDLVSDVIKSLLIGKIGYGAAAVIFHHFDHDAPHSALSSTLQIRVNDVARAVCGTSKLVRLSVASILERSGLPSVNQLAIRSVAVEAWKSLGPQSNTCHNPLTSIFGPPVGSNTRAGERGYQKTGNKIPYPLLHQLGNSYLE